MACNHNCDTIIVSVYTNDTEVGDGRGLPTRQAAYPVAVQSPPGVSATFFFFSSRRRHTRFDCDWSSDVCSSDLLMRSSWLPGTTPRMRSLIGVNMRMTSSACW